MRREALALLCCAGCISLRAGAGLSVDSEGRPGVQGQVGFGFGGPHQAVTMIAGVGAGSGPTTRLVAVDFHYLVVRPHDTDEDQELPRSLLRVDLRAGARSIGDHAPAADLGVGAAWLRVVGGNAAGCLFPGIGDATRDAFGAELWLDGLIGGPSDLGWGMATIGAVYQIDWYSRRSDCGS